MTDQDIAKVKGHARDHVAYRWARCLPVRHDRRDWTPEETELYNAEFDKAEAEYRKEHGVVCACGSRCLEATHG